MKFPKITIDKNALKVGFWGNTWKNWGYILVAFLALYALEAGYFTGLLFISKAIRGTTYRALPTQYFGNFERENLNVSYSFPEAHSSEGFNRPQGCTTVEEPEDILGEVFYRPTGVEKCLSSKNNNAWTLFPWVLDTQAAGEFPGCSEGVTVLTQETSPAFVGDIIAPPAEAKKVACQNFVPLKVKSILGEASPPTVG